MILRNLVEGLDPMDRFQANLGLEFRPKYFSLRSAHRPTSSSSDYSLNYCLKFRVHYIIKLLAQGQIHFDRKSFREMVEREGLLDPENETDKRPSIGIRSFMHPIDSLEERCESFLDLVPHFDGRYIRQDSHWQSKIVPELQSFLSNKARGSDYLRLIIDAHVSVAFAAGAVLNVKSGKSIELEQRTNGRRFWSIDDTPLDPNWPKMVFDEEIIATEGDAIAIAICLTHDISSDVRAFMKRGKLPITKILHCKPDTGSSQRSIQSGRHASMLAEAVVRRLQTISPGRPGRRHTHIFMAGPNGLAFFLGQHQQAIGPVSIYEWDFDGQRDGGYVLGISL